MNKDNFDLKKELNFAFSCIQNNNYQEAVKIYEQILEKNYNSFEANSNLGMLFAQQNDLNKAEPM